MFAGAAAPLSVSGFAFDANSTPQGEGFTLPPPQAAPPTEYRPTRRKRALIHQKRLVATP